MSNSLKLIQALGSKICHDLAGSIGTIDNCLGLLDSDNKIIRKQAKNLVLEESKNLVKRIKFFRSTYGLAENELKLNIVEMVDILRKFFEDTKINFNAHIMGDLLSVDAHMAKVAYSLVSIASENIGLEGEIDLYVNEKDDTLFKVHSKGRKLHLKHGSFAVLGGNITELLTITNCREYYASNICSEHGYKLSISKNAEFIEYFVIKS